MALDINNIVRVPFPDNQFIKEVTAKKQIYLHHTAGNSSGVATASYWAKTNERVATAFIISGKVKPNEKEKNGSIVQCFGSKYWGYHLGLQKERFIENKLPYISLDKISVGIEVCNWGYVNKQADGTFKNYVGGLVDKADVIELEKPYKNHKFWHNYTDEQINNLKELLLYLCDKYGIDKSYNEDIWGINLRALKGESGIYTHNSIRKDKSDIYPHPKMIEMLKSLKG